MTWHPLMAVVVRERTTAWMQGSMALCFRMKIEQLVPHPGLQNG